MHADEVGDTHYFPFLRASRRALAFALFLRLRSFDFGLRVAGVEPLPRLVVARLLMSSTVKHKRPSHLKR